MKSGYFIFLFGLILFKANAQTKIEGGVKDGKMRPLIGASIAVKNGYDGAITDSAGNYHFTTTDQGTDTLIFSLTGYKSIEKAVQLNGQAITLNVVLKEAFNELSAVTITAGSFSAGDNKKGVVLSSLDILTTSTNADISSAMRLLPGTQQNGESSGLFVHGGTAGETAQYMDGAVIQNPYYAGGPQIMQRGRFDPRLFSGTMFATGGYSALYGNAMSSVLLMNSNDLPEKSEYEIDVSPIAYVNLRTQQLARDKKSAYGISYNYINVWPEMQVVNTYFDITKTPVYHTANFYYHRKTKGGMIKYYTEFSHNDVGYSWQDIDSLVLKDKINVANNNWYNNLNWTELLGAKWKMTWANSFSMNHDHITRSVLDNKNEAVVFDPSLYWMNNKIFTYLNSEDHLQSRFVLEKIFRYLNAIRFGGEYDYAHTDGLYNGRSIKFNDHYGAVFAENDLYFTNNFMLKSGIRAERSALINETKVAPRISTAYRIGPNEQLSAAYGIFYQKPEAHYLMYNQNLRFTKSTQYILNYQKSTTSQILRLEAYYKKYDDLISLVPATQVNDYPFSNDGYGHAEGFDLFWKDQKTFPFKYWISYSYIHTKRQFLNYPTPLQPDFITPHTFSAVLQQFIPGIKSQVNFSYSFATGRPYYYFAPDLQSHTYQLKTQGKSSDYNNLDFSIDYLPDFGKTNKKMTVMFVATIKNILGLQQIYTYNYSYDGSYKQPVWPMSKRQYFIGVFFNFGRDRSQEIINENL
jgi:hypothetical protein